MSRHFDAFTYLKYFPCLIMLSRTLRSLFNLSTAFPSSEYHFCVRLLSLTSFIKDKVASPYNAIANGSPCVVPSLDRITFLFTKSLDGLQYEFCIAGSIEGHIFAMFFKASIRFRELNAFCASISTIASESVFSYCVLSV